MPNPSPLSSPETLYNESINSSDSDLSQDTWHRDHRRVWISAGEHTHRTLVLCFDGTGDKFDGDNSNIVQLVALLQKDKTDQQLVYYQSGIGSYANPKDKFSITPTISSALDSMFAWNMSSHIKDGYSFLMQNYTYGDKICIFGFSRGAYTARGLAGMLKKVGLLPLSNFDQLPFAYEMYTREDEEGLELSLNFKRTFCREVRVEFMGVWDTVASIGLIPRYLPFVSQNNDIKYLRHALALDERRVKFLPSFCVEPKKKKIKTTDDKRGKYESETKQYADYMNNEGSQTDALEVWFAGVHTDVGGGSVGNDTIHALSRIPLRWMIRECFRTHTGIIFDAVMLQKIGLNICYDDDKKPVLGDVPARIPAHNATRAVVDSKAPAGIFKQVFAALWSSVKTLLRCVFFPVIWLMGWHSVRTPKKIRLALPDDGVLLQLKDEGYEAQEELEDALCQTYDQIEANWMWLLLEYLPMRVKKQKAIVAETKDVSGYKWMINRGQGRKVFKREMKEGMKVHRSVKSRLEAIKALESPYVPHVRPTLLVEGKAAKSQPTRLKHEDWNVDVPEHWEWVE